MTTSDWITLVGAVGTLIAAGIAVLALWKIGDERRRSFNLGLLVQLLTAMGEPGVELTANNRVKLLLRILPIQVAPVLRVHLGQGETPDARAYYDAQMAGVDRFGRDARVVDVTTVDLSLAAATWLGTPSE